jgi:hypothetical protein
VRVLRLLPVLGVDLLRQTLVLRLGILFDFGFDGRFVCNLLQFLLLLLQDGDLRLRFGDLAVHLADLLDQLVFSRAERLLFLLEVVGKGGRYRLHLGVVGAGLLLKHIGLIRFRLDRRTLHYSRVYPQGLDVPVLLQPDLLDGLLALRDAVQVDDARPSRQGVSPPARIFGMQQGYPLGAVVAVAPGVDGRSWRVSLRRHLHLADGRLGLGQLRRCGVRIAGCCRQWRPRGLVDIRRGLAVVRSGKEVKNLYDRSMLTLEPLQTPNTAIQSVQKITPRTNQVRSKISTVKWFCFRQLSIIHAKNENTQKVTHLKEMSSVPTKMTSRVCNFFKTENPPRAPSLKSAQNVLHHLVIVFFFLFLVERRRKMEKPARF